MCPNKKERQFASEQNGKNVVDEQIKISNLIKCIYALQYLLLTQVSCFQN